MLPPLILRMKDRGSRRPLVTAVPHAKRGSTGIRTLNLLRAKELLSQLELQTRIPAATIAVL